MSFGGLASYLVGRKARRGQVQQSSATSEVHRGAGSAHAPEGSGDGVEVVRSNGDKLPVPAKVGVELVLEVNEALVRPLGKRLLESEDGSCEVGPDGVDRGGNVDLEHR